jgi:hypothetical protein
MNIHSVKAKVNKLIDENLFHLDQCKDIRSDINSLDLKSLEALHRALNFEIKGIKYLRDKYSHDLYVFDDRLNKIFSALLNSQSNISPILSDESPSLFDRNKLLEDRGFDELQKTGYLVTPYRMSGDQIRQVYENIADFKFENRGIIHKEILGSDIIPNLNDEKKIKKLLGRNGDTLWIKDQNDLVNNEIFKKIALDPYLLSMASRYLGCCPIHVQTNFWFSFPTFENLTNKSSNGQLFHQDKEFLKFLKVFIYLTDVDETNGPHCYVEGSHIDEAHKYGIMASERLSDDDVIKLYGKNRIKELLGTAGTIAFGDTSCLHKGTPLKKNCRVMLQIEYASSLYLSPVPPFSSIENYPRHALPSEIWDRITKNYSDQERIDFMSSIKVESISPIRRVINIIKLLKRTFSA